MFVGPRLIMSGNSVDFLRGLKATFLLSFVNFNGVAEGACAYFALE